MLATIPSSLLRVGSVRRLDSLCLKDWDQTTCETNCGIVEVTSNDIEDQNAHTPREDGTSWCRTFCLPTAAQRCDLAVSGFEKYLQVRDIHGVEPLVSDGLNESDHACVQYLRVCFASGRFGSGQAGTLISGLRRYVLPARPCGAELEDHRSVSRTMWRVSRHRVECGDVNR